MTTEMSATPTTDLTPELEARGQKIWDELVSRYGNGPLPFVKPDPSNPGAVLSLWAVEPSGDENDDRARGCFYAEFLVHRAKAYRHLLDPFEAISHVLVAIAEKGSPGATERGFMDRIAMLALAASLN
jgi:hypothetical protein